MRVLIIHHLETCWENGYRKFGTSFEELQEKFLRHLRAARYDKVILTRFEDFALGDDYFPELAEKISVVHEYGYGWPAEALTEKMADGYSFAPGGTHSEAVMLTPWMRELQGAQVRIAGAFDGECVEDLEIALRAVGVAFKRLEKLIVG